MPKDRRNQVLRLRGGRALGFAEYGAFDGRPVFHFHGSASSRLEHPPYEGPLEESGLRLICVDRPGHGLSDFVPGRRLVDWPDDVRQLAEALRIDQFHVEGYSAGGAYALACAHFLPDRVRAAALIASPAPMERSGRYSGLPLPNRMLAWSARWAPPLTRLLRWAMRRRVVGDEPQSLARLMSSLPESDRRILAEPRVAAVFATAIREGFRLGSRGAALDDVLLHRDWGFDLQGVRSRVDVWHGTADVNVSPAAADFLGGALPRARVTRLPGEGHFFPFERWGEVLRALVEG